MKYYMWGGGNLTVKDKIDSLYNKSMLTSFYTTYPNGRLYGVNNTAILVPCYNPSGVNLNVTEMYVYDSNGGFTDIKSSVQSTSSTTNGLRVNFTFNSSYVGRLLRIDIDKV